MSIRLLLADDQALIRTGLRALTAGHAGITVIGEAGNGKEAVELTRRLCPDVVLMDVRMPGMDGVAATRTITTAADTAGVRVVILTTFDLDEYVYGALRAGASGFLLKDAPPTDILAAIEVVAAGDALIAPSITRRLIRDFAKQQSPQATTGPDRVPPAVTEREREVLTLIGQGLSNHEIAAHLHISPATAKGHVGRLLTKLDARDRVHLVILAYRTGLVR